MKFFTFDLFFWFSFFDQRDLLNFSLTMFAHRTIDEMESNNIRVTITLRNLVKHKIKYNTKSIIISTFAKVE
jgi:hypothetical protein